MVPLDPSLGNLDRRQEEMPVSQGKVADGGGLSSPNAKIHGGAGRLGGFDSRSRNLSAAAAIDRTGLAVYNPRSRFRPSDFR